MNGNGTTPVPVIYERRGTPAPPSPSTGGLSWQTIALVLAAAGVSTGSSYAVHRVADPPHVVAAEAPADHEARIRALEEAQHRAEVAEAGRTAHLDEQLGSMRAAIDALRADVAALAIAKGTHR